MASDSFFWEWKNFRMIEKILIVTRKTPQLADIIHKICEQKEHFALP